MQRSMKCRRWIERQIYCISGTLTLFHYQPLETQIIKRVIKKKDEAQIKTPISFEKYGFLESVSLSSVCSGCLKYTVKVLEAKMNHTRWRSSSTADLAIFLSLKCSMLLNINKGVFEWLFYFILCTFFKCVQHKALFSKVPLKIC